MKIFSLVFTGLFCLISYGCNTVEGLGKDIQKGGEAIQKSAEKTSKNI